MSDSRNFILAIALSVIILIVWQTFISGPSYEKEKQRIEAQKALEEQAAANGGVTTPQASGSTPSVSGTSPGAGNAPSGTLPREQALAASPRIAIETPAVTGSLALRGARLDDLKLRRYHETPDEESPIITLFSPRSSADAYYAQYGWSAQPGSAIKLPDAGTVWTPMSREPLTPERPLTLYWENGEGIRFEIRYEIDENYLVTVSQSISNTTGTPVTLFPYGQVIRHGDPKSQGYWILHEGFLGDFDQDFEALTYGDAQDLETGSFTKRAQDGWLGITSKYWMTVLAPEDGTRFQGRFMTTTANNQPVYQADYILDGGVTVAAGGNASSRSFLFAGAKKLDLINQYEESAGIGRFNLAIDWGWFFFLTKPFFIALKFLANLTGNFGVAILLFTILVKAVFFPLANKSYEAMTKMKKVQPDMQKIRERHKDDKMKQQQELMELYKREKINPLAGCLPILIQIPVFFSLYKVLFVTIEMRHAPFFGWIQDLSAPDPTSIFNLFGLLPYDPGAVPMIGPLLMIGVWPLVMGISMWFQMQMNPQPQDEIQKKVFAYMPFLFTIMLASFSAGLVIYWAWNNILSIAQQYVIMRRMGVEPEWKNNISLPGFLKGKDAAPADAKPQAALADTAPADKSGESADKGRNADSGKSDG